MESSEKKVYVKPTIKKNAMFLQRCGFIRQGKGLNDIKKR